MRSQARTALLSALPAVFGGRTRSFSALRGAASALQRRRPRLLHPAGRAALSALPSPSAPAAAAELSSSAQQPEAAAPQAPIPTTVSVCAPETARGRHVFKIAGYSLLKGGLGVGRFIRSSTFTAGGYDWCVRYYPDGFSKDGDIGLYEQEADLHGYISFYLELMTKGADVRAVFDFRLVSQAGDLSPPTRCSWETPKLFSDTGSLSWGYDKFKKWSNLERSQYLQDDIVMVQCDVMVIKGTPVSQSETVCDMIQLPPPQSDLLDGLRKFLEAEKMADVIFKVKGEVFHAHRFVLAMRSPVFEEELRGPLGENNQRHITIEDMEPAIFKALLHFIYTDSLPPMVDLDRDEDEEMVRNLLVAADRYALERMKLICEGILCNRLYVDNVATTFALANQHHCIKLKDACIGFIASSDRIDDVIATRGYVHLRDTRPDVIAEMWGKLVKPQKI